MTANTVRAYRSDWEHYASWCKARQRDAMPASPAMVILYLNELATNASLSTVMRRLAGILYMYKSCGFISPMKMQPADLKATLRRIGREKGTASRGKAALLTEDVVRLLGVVPETVLGARDRALLLIGFTSGFLRSELAALRVDDVEITGDGLKISLRSSTTDGGSRRDRVVHIAKGSHAETCPVRAYTRWLELAGITVGPVFCRVGKGGHISPNGITPQTVCLVVKRRCAQAGMNPAKFAAHSLRAGLATQAARNGVSISSIMQQTGHRSVAMCRRLIRDAQLISENAAARLGL
jgi:site-specific recombinase XerD